MATQANGTLAPAGTDAFLPDADMRALAGSFKSRIHIPAANSTARAALTSTCGWTPTTTEPLIVLQTDVFTTMLYDGTRWHRMGDVEIGSQVVTSTPTLSTAYGTLATVTATTLGGALRVTGTVMLNNANSGADRTANVQITLDGTPQTPVVSTIQVPLVGGAAAITPFAFTWELSAPSAGSHTILLQALASINSAITIPAASLVVIEKP